jgi:large subunit ribosomal protein L1
MSAPVLARKKVKTPPVLSKKQLAAKAKKRALKALGKSIYEKEKMTLAQALNVLRVHFLLHLFCCT